MNLFEKLYDEINEATSLNWNLDDVIPVKLPSNSKPGKGGGGAGQETKVIGKKETEKPEDGQGKPGDQGDKKDKQGQGQGQGQDSGEQDPNANVQQGKGASTKKTKGQDKIDKGKGSSKASDVNNGKEWMDDHSKIEESDGTSKSIVNQVYKDVEADYQRKIGQGSGDGNLISRVKKFLKEEFDVAKVLTRIGTFKRKISEYIKRVETYQASLFNPITQQGQILAKGSPSLKFKQKKSALLFFAPDTSGSITGKDYESIMGYLNNIVEQFEKRKHGIDGEAFIIPWDTAVHPPIKKWKRIPPKPSKDLTDEQRKQLALKGGGGTDIDVLFKWLDKQFVKTIDGKDFFVFGDKMENMGDEDEEDKNKIKNKIKENKNSGIQIRQALKSKEKYEEPKWKKGFENVPQGAININEGGFANVPFLLIYTDGYFGPPDISQSKLYRNNPGNILYIVTTREGIQNVRPKNYIYHDLHGED
jgi:hypothetical protein